MKPLIQLTASGMVAGAVFGLFQAAMNGQRDYREEQINAAWQEVYEEDMERSMETTKRALAAAEGWKRLAARESHHDCEVCGGSIYEGEAYDFSPRGGHVCLECPVPVEGEQ